MRLLILLILILTLSCGVKCANLLQHGPPAGDSSGPTTDKGSVTVSINPGFILYGETYSNLFVNDDAAISFNSPLNKVDLQDNWPLGSNKTVVCLYCADVDVTKGGEIFYQLRTDLNTRAVVADDLKTYTEIPAEFDPAWVFVATWVNVKSFGNNDDEGSGSTFQVVMTTDGNVSVVIFLYDKVTWAIDIERIPGYGDTQTEVKTVVGFNAGDGVKHKIHPSSFTENLLNLPNLNNTKGESGKIIYRVDTEVIVVDTLRETEESTTTAPYDTSTPELSPQTTKETSLGTSTVNGETSGTTVTSGTTTLETTSTLGTTTTPETITSSETTVTLETTSPETTVPLETTTPSATTVTSETTTSEETTEALETTTPSATTVTSETTTSEETIEAPETITPSATTLTSETTMSEETTEAPETTTSSETIMTLETITSPETIVALETTTTSETTTSPQTTVTLETTTSSEATMKSETITSPETTVTLETTTSSEATMTSEATTSSETTVTLATTMTSEKAVTSEAISNSQTTQSNDIAATETSTKEQTVIKNDTNSQRLTTSQYAAIGVSTAVLVVSAVGIVVIVKIKWSSTPLRKPTHVAPIHSNGQSKPYCEFKIPRPKVRNRVEVI